MRSLIEKVENCIGESLIKHTVSPTVLYSLAFTFYWPLSVISIGGTRPPESLQRSFHLSKLNQLANHLRGSFILCIWALHAWRQDHFSNNDQKLKGTISQMDLWSGTLQLSFLQWWTISSVNFQKMRPKEYCKKATKVGSDLKLMDRKSPLTGWGQKIGKSLDHSDPHLRFCLPPTCTFFIWNMKLRVLNFTTHWKDNQQKSLFHKIFFFTEKKTKQLRWNVANAQTNCVDGVDTAHNLKSQAFMRGRPY